MDENMKIELKPQFDYESECKSVELEIINQKNLVDARLDEIDNQPHHFVPRWREVTNFIAGCDEVALKSATS